MEFFAISIREYLNLSWNIHFSLQFHILSPSFYQLLTVNRKLWTDTIIITTSLFQSSTLIQSLTGRFKPTTLLQQHFFEPETWNPIPETCEQLLSNLER